MKITLCGSTRFMKEYEEWNIKLTMAGHLVYSVARPSSMSSSTPLAVDEKQHLDLIHLAKIEESDAIFIIDPNFYMGESTNRERAWAKLRDKKIFHLSKPQFHTLLDI